MYKVDIVNPGNLNLIVGPVATIKRILRNRDFFLDHGFDITLCARGKEITTFNYNKSVKQKRSLKNKVRGFIDRKLAPHSRFFTVLLMKYVERSYLNGVVKPYFKMGRTPDIAVFHGIPEAYYFLKSGLYPNTKTAVFYHSDGIPLLMDRVRYPKLEKSKYFKVLQEQVRYIVEHADKSVCICKIGKVNMMKEYNLDESKVSLVVNGIDDFTSDEANIFNDIRSKRTSDIIKLCCVGSVQKRKGQMKILEAFDKLPKDIAAKYHVTIIGDGPDLNVCKQYAEEHGLNGIFEFTGAMRNIDVFKEHAKADAYILMSENEGLPIAILEALRAGLAIISTNVSGIPETVCNDNGILIEPDMDELVKVLSTPDKYDWGKMGMNSRELFEKQYTFERMRADYLKMLNELADKIPCSKK